MMTAQTYLGVGALGQEDYTLESADRKHTLHGLEAVDYSAPLHSRHSQLPYTLSSVTGGGPGGGTGGEDDLSYAMPHFLPPQQTRYSEQELADSLDWQAFAQGASAGANVDGSGGESSNAHLQLSQEMLNSISSHPSAANANSLRGMFIGSGGHDRMQRQQAQQQQQQQQHQSQQQQQQTRGSIEATGIPISIPQHSGSPIWSSIESANFLADMGQASLRRSLSNSAAHHHHQQQQQHHSQQQHHQQQTSSSYQSLTGVAVGGGGMQPGHAHSSSMSGGGAGGGSGGGRGATVAERKAMRRYSHNAVERRRRDNINEQIQELALIVPIIPTSPKMNSAQAQGFARSSTSPPGVYIKPEPGASSGSNSNNNTSTGAAGNGNSANANNNNNNNNSKPNKGLILRKSVEYIRQLQQHVRASEERQARLEQEILRLGGVVPPQLPAPAAAATTMSASRGGGVGTQGVGVMHTDHTGRPLLDHRHASVVSAESWLDESAVMDEDD